MSKVCMNVLISLCLISFLLLGGGCSSAPEIDASSDAAFKASIQNIVKSIPENKRKEFQKTITGMGVLVALAKEGNEKEIRKFFDGMTYDDIMEKAQEMREKMRNQ
ncbi:DUF6694 family lipoprotein [Halodesulfovibrio spirochaetisodalis]|uniref:Lipoprotein n=1 Tax=Halodesulfovibrio spirochaetisodalis TaxID=1560234 RepID=A0A1B7XMQ6_9BACT|nr:DUF6694 family lipoprotein [Halodesulfovibrio spirochaetisodalis]OBQ56800.1 hypothetical protein SP90_01620 [Halodesulfovibrio spirochaetisodalis]